MDAEAMIVRAERPGDADAIRAVNLAGFPGSGEADLVDHLRRDGHAIASFVAELDRRVLGHILFSRVFIEAAGAQIPSVALAPMAVLPETQRRGIGDRLVRFGLQRLAEQGERSVLVLGHPHYYERFGFSSARARLLVTPFPPEAFMALELVPDALRDVVGAVRYPPAFGLEE